MAGQATVRYWYELDGRGDVIALTTATGAVAQQYSYDPWGKLLPQLQSTGGGALGLTTEAVPQPLRYRGYWYDGWYDGAALDNSGTYASTETRPVAWYWLSTRSYDPALERFLQPDPSALDGVRSYAYCHDDPIDCADPSGLVSEPGGPGGPIQIPLFEGFEPYTPGPFGESNGSLDTAGASGVPDGQLSLSSLLGPGMAGYDENAAATDALAGQANIGYVPPGKAVAALGRIRMRFLSGYGNTARAPSGSFAPRTSIGFEPTIDVKVLVRSAAQRGFRFAADFRDTPPRAAYSPANEGQFDASHAEVQASVQNPGEPFASSKELCNGCVNYLRFQAADTWTPIVVAEPSSSALVFYPDGSLVVRGLGGSRAIFGSGDLPWPLPVGD